MWRDSRMKVKDAIWCALACLWLATLCLAADPSPKPWPLQFHAELYATSPSADGGPVKQSVIDLWYDYPNQRNYNIIQNQLGPQIWDLEWNNGTSYYFDLENKTCKTVLFPIGILRPEWLENAHYLGVREIDGFTCNVWEKVDFITYYEDVKTQVPVGWLFYTGRIIHVISFTPGAVLSDPNWQAPVYCFPPKSESEGAKDSSLLLPSESLRNVDEPWKRWVTTSTIAGAMRGR